MTYPQTINASASPEVQINDNFLATAWAGAYSKDATGDNTGLKRTYNGSQGWGGFSQAGLTHTFGSSTTTYVSVALVDGAMDFSTSNSNFNDAANYVRVETVITGGSAITGGADYRGGPGGLFGGGAAASTPATCIPIACGDETTAITTGTAKVTFRMPFAMTGVTVRASLTTAQSSGSIFTVDIKENGSSILSTKLTIDNTEKTSTTAATPAVVSDSSLADDSEITIDVDQVGDGTARGLKVYLIGTV